MKIKIRICNETGHGVPLEVTGYDVETPGLAAHRENGDKKGRWVLNLLWCGGIFPATWPRLADVRAAASRANAEVEADWSVPYEQIDWSEHLEWMRWWVVAKEGSTPAGRWPSCAHIGSACWDAPGFELVETERCNGLCCRAFTLGAGPECPTGMSPAELQQRVQHGKLDARMTRWVTQDLVHLGACPTAPDGPGKKGQTDDGVQRHWYTCKLLDADGNCTGYEERPATCRNFPDPGARGACEYEGCTRRIAPAPEVSGG